MELISSLFLAVYFLFAPINTGTIIKVEMPNMVIRDLQASLYSDAIDMIHLQEDLIQKADISNDQKQPALIALKKLEKELDLALIDRLYLKLSTKNLQTFDFENLKILIQKSSFHLKDGHSIFEKALVALNS
jgi:hypothetical protein